MTLVGISEAAEICGVSPCIVRRWANAGVIPCVWTLPGDRRGKRRFDSEHLRDRVQRGDLPAFKSSDVLLRRIWAKVTQDGSGCWLYTGIPTTAGYGQISVGSESRSRAVHRVMYEAVKGPIPPGLQIDHLCRVRACCNPWHLEAVTRAENLRRGHGVARRNVRKTRCVNGHLFDHENTHYHGNHWRSCRRCHADREAQRRERLRAASLADLEAAS